MSLSNAPATPGSDSHRKTALKRAIDRALEVVFGAADQPAIRTEPQADEVEARGRPAPASNSEQFLNALQDAMADFHYSEVRNFRRFSPDYVYQVHQVCVIRTPENTALVADFDRLSRKQRAAIVKAKLGEFEGFDITEFSDARIEDNDANQFFVAGEGAQRKRLCVEFHGEFVQRAAVGAAGAAAGAGGAAGAAPAPATGNRAAPGATLAAGPQRVPPSRVATLASEPVVAAATALVLHITEPGQPERSISLSQFPVRIGRSEDCEVMLESPYVSRLHATIVRDGATGPLRVINHSSAGSKLDGSPLALDDEGELADGAVLTLASATPAATVTLRASVPPVAPAQPLRPSQVATLMPPVAPAAPAAPAVPASQKTLVDRPEPATPHADALNPPPMARLRLRLADGHSELHDIGALPYEIGRALEGEHGHAIGEGFAKVSRLHLRIVRLQASAFVVHNLAHASNGTWIAGECMDKSFTLKAVAPSSQDGWCILGERALSGKSVAIRLERRA